MSLTYEKARSMPVTGEAGRDRPALRTLIGACIGMVLGPSPVILLSFGVYLLPIINDTGWDRALVASSVGSPMIIAGLMAPVVGWLTNYFGPRRFLTFSFPVAGVAIMLLGAATSAPMFFAIMAMSGVLISGQTLIPYVYCVSGWFEERRGLALGTMLACTGVGLAVMPPLAAQLIAHLGWRGSYIAFGAMVLVVGVPVSRWLIADPPVAAIADRAAVPGIAWRQALATRTCWLLMVSVTLLGATSSAGAVNLHVWLVERGVPAGRASFVMSLLGVSMIVARLIFGHLFDRVRPQRLTILIGSIAAVAFVLLATFQSPWGVMLAAVLIGIGFGAEGDALSYMTSRAFGMRDFGTIFGFMFLGFTAGGSAGPVVFAVLKSRSGTYQSALWLAAGACVVATVLVMLIKDRDLPYLPNLSRRLARKQADSPTVT